MLTLMNVSILVLSDSKFDQERNSEMTELPEDCVCKILSFTTPADACRSTATSSTFRSAVDSDFVWERILPRDHRKIIARSEVPVKFLSKKELFFNLCNPILLDGGTKSFKLEKSSGKISYMLSARDLTIAMGNHPNHWTWISSPDSRFHEVAVLKAIQQLEIEAKITTQMLSPNTKYGAFLIMKVSENAYGLNSVPSETTIEVGKHKKSTQTAFLCGHDIKKQHMEMLFYTNRVEKLKQRAAGGGETKVAREREDGWMEVEIGDFFNGDDGVEEEVKMSLREVTSGFFKGGLIVEGVEVRPKT